MGVQSAPIFVFEGENLIREKVHFDHAMVLRQLGALRIQHTGSPLLVWPQPHPCRNSKGSKSVLHLPGSALCRFSHLVLQLGLLSKLRSLDRIVAGEFHKARQKRLASH
jgi:hypothetical protein